MADYPITLPPDDNGTFLATCPDLPEVTTFGDDEADAVARAAGAVSEAIAARLDRFGAIPRPSPGQRSARLSLHMIVALVWALREAAGRGRNCSGALAGAGHRLRVYSTRTMRRC